MQGHSNIFLRIILKRASTEAHVYMRRHQGAKVEHFDVSNVIYHKFSHGAVSYTLNGENVNVMLECKFQWRQLSDHVFRKELFPCLRKWLKHLVSFLFYYSFSWYCKLGAPLAQCVKRWPTDLAVPSSRPARGEIYSTIMGFRRTQPFIIIHSSSQHTVSMRNKERFH